MGPATHRARVSLVLDDGSEADLHPGDFIGRAGTATLRLDDQRVSEAHAMVSLRDGRLWLISLRGLLLVDGETTSAVVLEPGLDVWLADGVCLGVSGVDVPDRILAIEGDGLERQVLTGQSSSLLVEPAVVVRAGYVPDAAAALWSDGEAWRVRVGEGEVQVLDEGVHWDVGARRFRAVTVPLAAAGVQPTRLRGRLHGPLRIVARFDAVTLFRDGLPPIALSGVLARIVSELATLGGPTHWSVVAAELWRDPNEVAVRRRWDKNLSRLRRVLREHGVRPDLIRPDGNGLIELFLYEHDEVVDET